MNAYVTLITHNDYMIPAMVLANRGKEIQSQYPLYIMVTEDLSKENRDILTYLNYKIIDIQEYIPKNYLTIFNSKDIEGQTDRHGKNLKQIGGVHTFNKFQVGTLTQFEKVCFLDLDLFLIQNLDEVFNYDEYTCAGRAGLDHTCSQIFIARPNLQLYKKLCEFADNYIIPYEQYNLNNVLYTDEDIFTAFFKNRTYLPHYFDCQSFDLDWFCKKDFNKLKAVHFTTREKPGLNGKEFTQTLDYNSQYAYIYYGNGYVDTYQNIINTLYQKGVDYGKI